MKSPSKINISDILRGIYGGIIGTLCCVLPLAGIAAGIGFIPGVMTAPRYRLYFIAAGLILILLLTWRRLKITNMDGSRKISIIFTTLLSFFLVVTVFTYIITPAVSGLVSRYSLKPKRIAGRTSYTAKPKHLRLATLTISSLSCPSCKDVVEGLVNKVEGVNKAEVDAKTGNAKVTYDSELTDKKSIAKVVAGGFKGSARTAYKAKVVSDVKL